MGRKAAAYTVAEIAKQQGKSESMVLRALRGVEPACYEDGYNGRKVAAYSKEQIATAFPKVAKKRGRPAKA
jgi:predicted transcriptional regulator